MKIHLSFKYGQRLCKYEDVYENNGDNFWSWDYVAFEREMF